MTPGLCLCPAGRWWTQLGWGPRVPAAGAIQVKWMVGSWWWWKPVLIRQQGLFGNEFHTHYWAVFPGALIHPALEAEAQGLIGCQTDIGTRTWPGPSAFRSHGVLFLPPRRPCWAGGGGICPSFSPGGCTRWPFLAEWTHGLSTGWSRPSFPGNTSQNQVSDPFVPFLDHTKPLSFSMKIKTRKEGF